MPYTPGYYMPSNYYNPINPITPMPQQSYSAQTQQNLQGITWVDGEVGAKAYQMPQSWPAGTPIPLWDTNDTVIYLKSVNQMGMPNPLQRIHYTMEEQKSQQMLPSGQMSGTIEPEKVDYVTRNDLEAVKNELKELLMNSQSGNSQNGSNNGQNRGGNR